jgi:hypothetical protein
LSTRDEKINKFLIGSLASIGKQPATSAIHHLVSAIHHTISAIHHTISMFVAYRNRICRRAVRDLR